jgi:hypothetical protein
MYIKSEEDTCPVVDGKAFEVFATIEGVFLLPNVLLMLQMIYYQYVNTYSTQTYGNGNFHLVTWFKDLLVLRSWYTVTVDLFSDAVVIALCQAYADYATDDKVKNKFQQLTNLSQIVFQLTILNRYLAIPLFVLAMSSRACLDGNSCVLAVLKPFGAQKNSHGGLANLESVVNGIFLSAQDAFTGKFFLGGCPDEELFDDALQSNIVRNKVRASFFQLIVEDIPQIYIQLRMLSTLKDLPGCEGDSGFFLYVSIVLALFLGTVNFLSSIMAMLSYKSHVLRALEIFFEKKVENGTATFSGNE